MVSFWTIFENDTLLVIISTKFSIYFEECILIFVHYMNHWMCVCGVKFEALKKLILYIYLLNYNVSFIAPYYFNFLRSLDRSLANDTFFIVLRIQDNLRSLYFLYTLYNEVLMEYSICRTVWVMKWRTVIFLYFLYIVLLFLYIISNLSLYKSL